MDSCSCLSLPLACYSATSNWQTNRGSVDKWLHTYGRYWDRINRLSFADARCKLVVSSVLWVFVMSQIAEIREGAAKVILGADAKYGGHDDPSLVLRFIRD
jgi:hypothetical protein